MLAGVFDSGPLGSFRILRVSLPVFVTIALTRRLSMFSMVEAPERGDAFQLVRVGEVRLTNLRASRTDSDLR